MSPRFGFRTGSFPNGTTEQAASELAQLGYDCLEVCLEMPDMSPISVDQARCAALLRHCERIGIEVASVSYHGDREPPADRMANQERAIQVTAWLGAAILVMNAERTVDRVRQWAGHVDLYRRLCKTADGLGVVLAVEPEPLLVVDNSRDMVAMMKAVGSPRLRVNLDIGHAMVTDPDPAESIRLLGSAIVHLHLEDIKGRVHRHLPLGEGDIDFTAVRRALAEIHYQGPYVVDLFGVDDPKAAAARALGAMRERFA